MPLWSEVFPVQTYQCMHLARGETTRWARVELPDLILKLCGECLVSHHDAVAAEEVDFNLRNSGNYGGTHTGRFNWLKQAMEKEEQHTIGHGNDWPQRS